MPTANPVVSPSQERADGHGWRVSPGWVMLRRRFCRGTTMLRAISPVPLPTPCTGAKLFSLSLLKAGGKDPQLLIVGFFLGWSCCLLGNFNLLQFSWSWKCCLGEWRAVWPSAAAHHHGLFHSPLWSAVIFLFLKHFLSLQIWEGLTQRFHRVIALDFVGFGFSDKPVSSWGEGFSQLLLAQRLFCRAGIPGKLAFAVRFLLPFTSGNGRRRDNGRRDGEGAWWRLALSPSCLYLGLM